MRRLALTAAAWLLLGALPAPAETLGPREVVTRTADEVIAVLRQEDVPLAERQRRIEEIAADRFDFETIGRLVLARHWRALSPSDRAAFLAEFQRYLALSYGNRVDRYQEETVQVLDERPEARGDVTVRTRIVGGSADGTSVDYRLRQRDGRWRVIDVIVEGISALRSFRSQFQEVLERGGPASLLRQLRAKNEESAAGQAPPPEREGPATARPPAGEGARPPAAASEVSGS